MGKQRPHTAAPQIGRCTVTKKTKEVPNKNHRPVTNINANARSENEHRLFIYCILIAVTQPHDSPTRGMSTRRATCTKAKSRSEEMCRTSTVSSSAVHK